MKRIPAIAGSLALLAAGIAAVPFSSPRSPKKTKVMVHCPNGSQPARVTPPSVRIAVGDSIEWRMTGQVMSDSLEITLKDSTQAWPFGGALPAGSTSAETGDARVKGTYGYNVHLECRRPGGGTQSVVIDPDIIID